MAKGQVSSKIVQLHNSRSSGPARGFWRDLQKKRSQLRDVPMDPLGNKRARGIPLDPLTCRKERFILLDPLDLGTTFLEAGGGVMSAQLLSFDGTAAHLAWRFIG